MMNKCTQCRFIEVSSDPDPYDSFCDTDVKARCLAARNQIPKLTSRGNIKAGEPFITVACRPYMLDKECDIPSWCPLKLNGYQ